MIQEALIAGACIAAFFIGIFIQLRFTGFIIKQGIAELDEKLAMALKNTIENLPLGDIEPPNPMQMMLMQIIQDNMARSPAKVVARDDKGLFTAEDPK